MDSGAFAQVGPSARPGFLGLPQLATLGILEYGSVAFPASGLGEWVSAPGGPGSEVGRLEVGARGDSEWPEDELARAGRGPAQRGAREEDVLHYRPKGPGGARVMPEPKAQGVGTLRSERVVAAGVEPEVKGAKGTPQPERGHAGVERWLQAARGGM